jgi:hypothetical protein
MSEFEIQIVNYLEKKGLVAEVYYESFQWAEISHKGNSVVIRLYSHPNRSQWEFSYEESIRALQQAKAKLLSRSTGANLLEKNFKIDPEQVNEQAQRVLESIVNHPEREFVLYDSGRMGRTVDIYAPNIGGARYSLAGEFIGFLELKT